MNKYIFLDWKGGVDKGRYEVWDVRGCGKWVKRHIISKNKLKYLKYQICYVN